MVHVYVILSEVTGRCYVGISEDVPRRLSEHNAGKMKYTKAYRPWRLVYEEAFPDRMSARRREKYFKTGVVVVDCSGLFNPGQEPASRRRIISRQDRVL